MCRVVLRSSVGHGHDPAPDVSHELVVLFVSLSLSGIEIWEGDERRRAQFSEADDSLHGHNLFSDSPFL